MPRISRKGSGPDLQAFKREFAAGVGFCFHCDPRHAASFSFPNDSRAVGQNVYVAGLSAGGTLSAWIAQNRTAQKNQQIEIVYPVPGSLLSAP